MTIYGFYSWFDIFEEYVRYKIVQSIISRLHGVKQKEDIHLCDTYWSYNLKLAMLGILLSNHSYKARQAHYEAKIETSAHALYDGF